MLMNANDVPNLSPLTRVEGRREKEGEEVVVGVAGGWGWGLMPTFLIACSCAQLRLTRE